VPCVLPGAWTVVLSTPSPRKQLRYASDWNRRDATTRFGGDMQQRVWRVAGRERAKQGASVTPPGTGYSANNGALRVTRWWQAL